MTKLTDDEFLRSVMQQAHVEDGGFTDRVVSALPKKRRRFGKREAVIFGSALVAGVAGFAAVSGVQLDVDALAHVSRTNWLPIVSVAIVVGVAFWGALSVAADQT